MTDLQVQTIRDCFLAHPVPPYPPRMGLDPLGKEDEYAGFEDTPWDDVEPKHLQTWGFDISPTIGFALHSPPHMWNYYVPAFLVGSLLHEEEFQVTDGFVWQLRRINPGLDIRALDPNLPWWHGETHFANYSAAQCDCVVRYLRFLREKGAERPYLYDWEPIDERMLRRWVAYAKMRS